MIRDRLLPGVIVGLLADAVKLMVNYLAYLLNLTPVVFWQLIATRFLQKQDLFKPVTYLIGGIADITITIILGVLFFYFIKVFGSRYLYIKGIGFALAIWVGLFGTLLSQSVQAKLPQTAMGIMVTIASHAVFGLSLAYFYQRLGFVSKAKSRSLIK